MARNKYPEETVQKILDASLKLFVEKGYEQTSVLDIVNSLGGLTRGAFYHHFKSKEEVFDALSDKLFYDNNPFEAAKRQTHLTGLEKLKYILKKTSTEESDRRDLSISIIQLLDSPIFLKKLIIDTNKDVLVPLCQEIIEEGMIDGSIQTNNAKFASELFVIFTNFWTIPTIFPIADEGEALEKVYYLKNILNNMGIPVIDDELLALYKNTK
ncbi:MAG: TetR/AcrR family transcriptional regulator [Coprobacillus sp.]